VPVLHRHQIEAILVARSTMPKDPHRRDPGDVALLALMHRLYGGPAAARAPGLHFDKRYRISLPNDQIDVVAAQLESVRLDRPAARGEKRDCDALAVQTEYLTPVFPFGDWNEAACGRHGHTICGGYRQGKSDDCGMEPETADRACGTSESRKHERHENTKESH
jgi:hypothetical protein